MHTFNQQNHDEIACMQTTTRDYYRYKISIYMAGRRSFSVSQILKKKKIMNQNTFGTKIPFCDDDEFNLEDDDEEFLICSSAESLSKAKSRFSVSI